MAINKNTFKQVLREGEDVWVSVYECLCVYVVVSVAISPWHSIYVFIAQTLAAPQAPSSGRTGVVRRR